MADGSADSAAPPPGSSPGLGDDHPTAREVLERSIRPLATSVDGRQFAFQASLHGLDLQTGGYVVVDSPGETCIGQILTMRPDTGSVAEVGGDSAQASRQVRLARGEGIILDGGGHTFHDALVRPAT